MTDFRNATSEGNNNVATKGSLWRPLAQAVDGFDLDPAAGCEPENIAQDRFTPEDDGLLKAWYGTVWLNPPFSDKMAWYRRLVDQYRSGDVDRAIAVAPVDTSTEWFQRWYSKADLLCFLQGRAWYITNSPDSGSASFSSMVGVWNPTKDVRSVLAQKGTVVEPATDGQQETLDVP